MMNKNLDATILRYVGFGLLFLGVAVGLYMVRGALPVFVIGGIIAYALEPVLQKLEKNGRSRRSAVGFVFAVYILIGLVLLSLLAAAFQQSLSLVSNIPIYNQKVTRLVQDNRKRLDTSKLPSGVKASVNDAIDNSLKRISAEVPARATGLATAGVTGIGDFLVKLFLLNLIALGLMLEAQSIRGRLMLLVPPLYRRDVTELSLSINEILGRYVRGQLIVCGTFGVLCTIAFEILARVYGMQYPLVLGGVAALIYIIPYIGLAAITAASVLTAYLTARAGQGVPCAVAVLCCCVVFNLFIDYGVAPRVLGRGVGLHPLMVIFAILCGLHLAGPLGTIFAVPVFAALRVIAIYLFPQLAAPLPVESPAATAETQPHSVVSESGKRLAEAESSLAK